MSINTFRKIIKFYNNTSILFGILIPIICYNILPDINIFNDPLSRFGIEENTKYLWITFNIMISISMYSIGRNSNKYIDNPYHKKILDILNILSSIFLTLSALITMDIRIIHLTLASLFFTSSNIYIFIFGYFMKNKNIKTSIISIIITTINILFLILIFYFKISYGIFEVAFILNLIIWYFYIVNKYN